MQHMSKRVALGLEWESILWQKHCITVTYIQDSKIETEEKTALRGLSPIDGGVKSVLEGGTVLRCRV